MFRMSPIHVWTVALVLTLSTGRVSPQFHLSFDPSFTTINGCDGNIFPPSYWQAMCGFIKGNKLMFMHSEQHDPSSTFIFYQIKVTLSVIMPQSQSNRQKYHQCRNMIPRNNQCSNPHQSSNQNYILQFLKNTQRLAI